MIRLGPAVYFFDGALWRGNVGPVYHRWGGPGRTACGLPLDWPPYRWQSLPERRASAFARPCQRCQRTEGRLPL